MPDAYPDIQGRCPACGGASLFLGAGGYVTCSRIDCPDPDAATEALTTTVAEIRAEIRSHSKTLHVVGLNQPKGTPDA